MKYWYADEKGHAMIICIIMCVMILIIGFLATVRLPVSWDLREDMPSFGSTQWALSFVKVIFAALFVLWGGTIVGGQTIRHRRWHQYLVKYGTKCEGTVEDVILEQQFIVSNQPEVTVCSFIISYYSSIKKETIIFRTPALSFSAKKGDKFLCDVYEIAGKPKWTGGDNVSADDLVHISEGQIRFNINPFKLATYVSKNSRQSWFGNVVADNFRKINQ